MCLCMCLKSSATQIHSASARPVGLSVLILFLILCCDLPIRYFDQNRVLFSPLTYLPHVKRSILCSLVDFPCQQRCRSRLYFACILLYSKVWDNFMGQDNSAKVFTLGKRKLLQVWLVQNIEFHVEFSWAKKRFCLFYAGIYTHRWTSSK